MAGLVLTMVGAACAPNHTSTPGTAEAMFRDRTVRIVVGVGPGGGQDLYARLTAAHLAAHLPGSPTVVVENMPGAGGLVATQHLAQRAKPDALTIGLLSIAAVLQHVVGSSTAAIDIRRFPLIGSPADDAPVCVFSRRSGFDLAAWRGGRTPRMGMTGPSSGTAVDTLLLAGALGLRVHPVRGYQGTADIRAALLNGEVDGVCTEWNSFRASFTPQADYVPVVYGGGVADGGPPSDVPRAAALVSTESGRAMLSVVSALDTLARFYALPPGTAPEHVAVWRRAFHATMNDPALRAAAAAAGVDIRPRTADDVSARIDELLTLSPDVRRQIASLLQQTES